MVTIGKRIRELRTMFEWTQNHLAKELKVDRTTISKWETGGISEPDTYTINRLADIFGVSADYLLGRTDDPSPTINLEGWRNTSCVFKTLQKLEPEGKEEVLNFIDYVMFKQQRKKLQKQPSRNPCDHQSKPDSLKDL